MYSANCNDSASETTRAWAEIDLGALKHNFEYAKKRSDRRVICVLKADAYGHGAVECGRFLQRNGAEMFAVAALSEAVELRENGITIPILILGYTAPEYAETLSRLNLEQTVVDEAHAALSRQKIQLAVEDHTTLLVFTEEKIQQAIARAQQLRGDGNDVTMIPFATAHTREDYENYAQKNHISNVEFMDGDA